MYTYVAICGSTCIHTIIQCIIEQIITDSFNPFKYNLEAIGTYVSGECYVYCDIIKMVIKVSTRLEPIMLKNLTIIPSRTSQKFYPLFLLYSQIITY